MSEQAKISSIDALEAAQAEAYEPTRLTEAARAQISSVIDADVDAKISDLARPWTADVLTCFGSVSALETDPNSRFAEVGRG